MDRERRRDMSGERCGGGEENEGKKAGGKVQRESLEKKRGRAMAMREMSREVTEDRLGCRDRSKKGEEDMRSAMLVLFTSKRREEFPTEQRKEEEEEEKTRTAGRGRGTCRSLQRRLFISEFLHARFHLWW